MPRLHRTRGGGAVRSSRRREAIGRWPCLGPRNVSDHYLQIPRGTRFGFITNRRGFDRRDSRHAMPRRALTHAVAHRQLRKWSARVIAAMPLCRGVPDHRLLRAQNSRASAPASLQALGKDSVNLRPAARRYVVRLPAAAVGCELASSRSKPHSVFGRVRSVPAERRSFVCPTFH